MESYWSDTTNCQQKFTLWSITLPVIDVQASVKTGSLHWPDHTKVGKHWTKNRWWVWGRCPQLVICVSLVVICVSMVVICVSLVVTCVSSVFTDKIWNGLYYLFFFSVFAEHDVSDHTNIHQTNKITRQGRLGNHESRNDLISVRKPCHWSEGCHDGSTSTQNPSALCVLLSVPKHGQT